MYNDSMNGKLIRDNIPDIIRQSGRNPHTHVAAQAEFDAKLKQKLAEEVNEYITSENAEELADILEVIRVIAESKKLNFDDLEKIRIEKAKKNGSFSKKIILDSIAK